MIGTVVIRHMWPAYVVIFATVEYSNMSRCPGCKNDLAPFQTLCSKCYDARYSKIDQRVSLLSSLSAYVSNPLAITQESVSETSLSEAVVCLAIGIAACWWGGFAEYGYRPTLFSFPVFSGAFDILLKSAALSLALALLLARKNLRMYWDVALGLFVVVAMTYARWAWHVGIFSGMLRKMSGR